MLGARCAAHAHANAYLELSGQTAATQAVVADLRRCGSFLHNRLVGEPPPAPWLSTSARGASSNTSPAATPPARRASFSQLQESSLAPGNPALGGGTTPGGFRSPPPAPPSPPAVFGGCSGPVAAGLEPPSPGWSPAEPCTPAAGPTGGGTYHALTPSAAAPNSSSRPPLAGGGSGATGRAGSVGRAGPGGRPPAAAPPRNLASMPAAGRPSGAGGASRARDPSPQRRAGVGTGPAAAAATGTPLRSASPSPASTPQTRGAPAPSPACPGPAGPSGADAGIVLALRGAGAGAAASSSGGGARGNSSSHLPLAAQRALAAAAELAGGADGAPGARDHPSYHDFEHQHQQGVDAAPKPAGPPQLPLALRRAMQRYRDTLQTRDQLLQQHQQRRGGSNTTTATNVGPNLADTVAAGGRSYRSALARQYPSRGTDSGTGHQAGGSGAGGNAAGAAQAAAQMSRMSLGSASSASSASALGRANGGPQTTAQLRRRAQVVFAALVAAQTWLIQSLSDLARSRGTPGGVAAAHRRASQADTCAALLVDVELLRMELDDLQLQLRAAAADEEFAEAAATPVPLEPPTAGMCGRVGGSGGGAGGSEAAALALAGVAAGLGVEQAEVEEAAALWRNRFLRALLLCDPAGAGAGPSGRRAPGGASVGPQRQQLGQDGPWAGDAGPFMRRPLGFWLPDAMWAQAPLPGDEGSASAVAAPPLQSPSGEARWQVLLPAAVPVPARPPALLCASAQDAVAHGRAQLQLQATVFQLLLEGSLAASLLPRRRPPQPPPAALALAAQVGATGGRSWQRQHQLDHHHHHHQQRAAALEWERWLARCRLAHLLLFKGAWNRLCSVVELEEGDGGEKQADFASGEGR